VYGDAARRDVVLRNGVGMVFVGLSGGEFALLERTGTGWKITRASQANPLLGRIREVRIAAVRGGQTIALGADDHADSFNATDDEKAAPPWITAPATAWARATTAAGAQVFKESVDGDARAVHGAPTNDQIVTADIRPTTFYAGGGWAGLMARYVNASAYYFALLQNGGTVSLRRWMNGQVTVLDEAPFAVAQAPPIECGWTRWAAICGYTSTANS